MVVHPLRDPVVPPPVPAGAGMGCGGARSRQQGAGLKLPAAVSAFQTNNQQQSMKFTFSKVFDESTNQKFFFDETVQSTVREFLDGQNCLLFAYGVTNSGKTYTMQGMSLAIIFWNWVLILSFHIFRRFKAHPQMLESFQELLTSSSTASATDFMDGRIWSRRDFATSRRSTMRPSRGKLLWRSRFWDRFTSKQRLATWANVCVRKWNVA